MALTPREPEDPQQRIKLLDLSFDGSFVQKSSEQAPLLV